MRKLISRDCSNIRVVEEMIICIFLNSQNRQVTVLRDLYQQASYCVWDPCTTSQLTELIPVTPHIANVRGGKGQTWNCSTWHNSCTWRCHIKPTCALAANMGATGLVPPKECPMIDTSALYPPNAYDFKLMSKATNVVVFPVCSCYLHNIDHKKPTLEADRLRTQTPPPNKLQTLNFSGILTTFGGSKHWQLCNS
jgi:hypothetical protein